MAFPKLTLQQLKEIDDMLQSGLRSYEQIGDIFGVSKQRIFQLKKAFERMGRIYPEKRTVASDIALVIKANKNVKSNS